MCFICPFSKLFLYLPVMLFPFLSFSQGKVKNRLTIDLNAKPMVFAPGVVATSFDEWGITFTPDGNTAYFVRRAVTWTILYTEKVNGKWTTPKAASFSGKWKDSDPFISPDGRRIFFVSNRPLENAPQDEIQKNYHIWYADHLSGNKWGTPHYIYAPVNIEGINNFSPSVSNSGTLYFSSVNRDGHKGEACYYSVWKDNHFEKPRLLSLNGNTDTGDIYAAPDESFLIFSSENGFFMTYRINNEWTAAQKLGPPIDTGDPMSSPYVSPDGKTLYYTSGHGHSNILYIPVTIKQAVR